MNEIRFGFSFSGSLSYSSSVGYIAFIPIPLIIRNEFRDFVLNRIYIKIDPIRRIQMSTRNFSLLQNVIHFSKKSVHNNDPNHYLKRWGFKKNYFSGCFMLQYLYKILFSLYTYPLKIIIITVLSISISVYNFYIYLRFLNCLPGKWRSKTFFCSLCVHRK